MSKIIATLIMIVLTVSPKILYKQINGDVYFLCYQSGAVTNSCEGTKKGCQFTFHESKTEAHKGDSMTLAQLKGGKFTWFDATTNKGENSGAVEFTGTVPVGQSSKDSCAFSKTSAVNSATIAGTLTDARRILV